MPDFWAPPGSADQSTRQDFYLNIAVVIKQYVFQLQVPVDHTVLKREHRQGTEWDGWGETKKEGTGGVSKGNDLTD